jgi:hypothetical protein
VSVRVKDRQSFFVRYGGIPAAAQQELFDWRTDKFEASRSVLIGYGWHLDCIWGAEEEGNIVQNTIDIPHQIDIPHHWMKGDKMNSSYVFLCGVMWCRFGQQEAGKELLRATNSIDPDMSALAWAMLAKGTSRLRDLDKRAQNLNTSEQGRRF